MKSVASFILLVLVVSFLAWYIIWPSCIYFTWPIDRATTTIAFNQGQEVSLKVTSPKVERCSISYVLKYWYTL